MISRRSWPVLALCAACGGGGGGAPDAAPDATAAADNGVVPCGKPVIFVNADGVTIDQSDDMMDDATTNHSGVLAIGDQQPGEVVVAAPPDADAQRADVIATFAELSIPAYATRPAEGEYVMLVILEDSYFGPASGVTAVSPFDCDNQRPSNIAYLNAMYSEGTLEVAARFAVGTSIGLDPVPPSGGANCMRIDTALTGCGFADGVIVDVDSSVCTDGTQAQLMMLGDALGC